MKYFSFDKYWGLDWNKTKQGVMTCHKDGFIYVADTKIVSTPTFAIYHKKVSSEYCLMGSMSADMFIMQLKSIKEYGKIVKS